LLGEAGVNQYEISNFAQPGHRSRHNLKYWRRQPYIGFGLDAHSMLLADEGAVRFANTSDLDRYLEQVPAQNPFRLLESEQDARDGEVDLVGRSEAFEESLFLGLRLNEGLDLNTLRREFGEGLVQDALPALVEVRDAGLLELNTERIRLTPQGRLASNEVFSRLLIPAAA
jgi:oxygen-independent coproporphyrinogen-3 oxidase